MFINSLNSCTLYNKYCFKTYLPESSFKASSIYFPKTDTINISNHLQVHPLFWSFSQPSNDGKLSETAFPIMKKHQSDYQN
jgi:hypothetical protein